MAEIQEKQVYQNNKLIHKLQAIHGGQRACEENKTMTAKEKFCGETIDLGRL